MRPKPRPIHGMHLAALALAVFSVAFAVRLWWVLKVQSPHTAVYSDMGGYVYRAEQLLSGAPTGDPRSTAFYPWGTHTLIAGEFALFGRTSLIGIGFVHAFVGALPALCATLLTARIVPRIGYVALAGFGVALWHPQITYVGFFMSELWFSAGLMMTAWLVVRHIEGRTSALGTIAAGCALAITFAVRPQVVLSCAFLALGLTSSVSRVLYERLFRSSTSTDGLLGRAYRGLLRPLLRRWTLLLVPLAIAVVGSSVRLYRVSGGRIGVISENDALNRVFADTRVGKLESSWTNEKGERFGAWYAPAMKLPLKDGDTVVFDGYIGDPVLLDKIRRDHLRGVSLVKRVQRMLRNIRHLGWHAFPNPEEDFRGVPWRALLQRTFANAMLALIPVALIGMWSMRRGVAGKVVIANLVTIPIVAALYFAEARHRVPYDPFLVVAATAGLAAIANHARRLIDGTRWTRGAH